MPLSQIEELPKDISSPQHRFGVLLAEVQLGNYGRLYSFGATRTVCDLRSPAGLFETPECVRPATPLIPWSLRGWWCRRYELFPEIPSLPIAESKSMTLVRRCRQPPRRIDPGGKTLECSPPAFLSCVQARSK